jgi:hypothetical protein
LGEHLVGVRDARQTTGGHIVVRVQVPELAGGRQHDSSIAQG